MNPVKEIQKTIDGINSESKNRTKDIYLNAINNEFIFFDGNVNIPRISVKELDYNISVEIINSLITYIPEFLHEHFILKKRKPASEQHSLHFVKPVRGKYIYFVHMFKLDLLFGGDTSNIIEQGGSDYYPSYKTDRLYFKSRIIPENSILHHDDEIIDFSPIRIYDSKNVETDQHLHTFAIFDDINTKEISLEIAKLFNADLFNISPKIYPIIPYDYFTAVFNVINPTPDEIKKCVDLFEPLFIYIYSNYTDFKNLINIDSLNKFFSKELIVNNNKIILTDQFIVMLKEYFNKFKLNRDDEMIIKGWRKFEITN